MLCTVEKLLESIVKEQLVNYIEENEMLSLYQSGYRKLHSCETSLNQVISRWKELRDRNYDIVCVFLDLKRAFETIDRKILLQKLKNFGLKDNTFKWFESYLTGRKQCTKVNGTTSGTIENNLGVAQGSILGALTFIIYINEMPTVVKHAFVNLFADDTLVYIYGSNLHEMVRRLNENLNSLHEWFSLNKLKLNVSKTKYMYISKSGIATDSEIVINGEKIEAVDTIKYLGVVIDKGLKFNENAKYVCKKVAVKIHLFGRIAKNLTFTARCKVYKAIINPHFEYCASLLYSSNNECIDRLQKLQNRAIRIILRCGKRTNVKMMLNVLHLMSVKQTIIFCTLKMAFKIKCGLVPKYLTSHCNFNKENHGYCLRNNNDFKLPRYKKDATQRMLMYNGLKEFNKLPNEIKSETVFVRMVKKLKEFVKDNY